MTRVQTGRSANPTKSLAHPDDGPKHFVICIVRIPPVRVTRRKKIQKFSCSAVAVYARTAVENLRVQSKNELRYAACVPALPIQQYAHAGSPTAPRRKYIVVEQPCRHGKVRRTCLFFLSLFLLQGRINR